MAFPSSAAAASASSASSGGQTAGQQQSSGGQGGSPDLLGDIGGGGGGGGQGGGQHFGGAGRDGGTAGGEGGGERGFDYRKAFGETQGTLQRMTQEFGQMRQQQTEESRLLSKMREVFQPGDAQQADPVQGKISQYEQMLDYYIAQGVEAEKAGRAMPLTINNGIQMYRSLIEAANREKALESRLGSMQQALEQLQNPNTTVNAQAYQTMDTAVKNQIDSLFGANAPIEQRRAIFQAVGGMLAPILNNLQRTDPARWDMIRRDPEALKELASRAVRKHVPPKALEMIAQEQLKNTPMPIGEIRQAMRELRARTDIAPEQKAELEREMRQEMWEQMYRGGKIKVG